MNRIISERAFEDAIECALLRYGRDEYWEDAAEARESPPPHHAGLATPSGCSLVRRSGRLP